MAITVPDLLKPFFRFLRYPQERQRFFREFDIRKEQDSVIKSVDSSAKDLILFMVQGADFFAGRDLISGGTISIVSLCEETSRLKDVNHSEVVMCTFPGERLLFQHTQFKNETPVFRYSQLPRHFKSVQRLLVHVPEFMVERFVTQLDQGKLAWLQQVAECHVNIMNQNIRLMPPPAVVARLRRKAKQVSITTAHRKYCTADVQQKYQVPLHLFSVWISPEKYFFKPYSEKENLMVVSPDFHPRKEEVLALLKNVPGLQIQIIQNLTYEAYKELISRAKWSLTFGEGLDGYFIEPVFSGAISLAIYNQEFFTPDFAPLRTVYASIDDLVNRVLSDLQELDTAERFTDYQQEEFARCADHYSHEQYIRQLTAFYRREYTFA